MAGAGVATTPTTASMAGITSCPGGSAVPASPTGEGRHSAGRGARSRVLNTGGHGVTPTRKIFLGQRKKLVVEDHI